MTKRLPPMIDDPSQPPYVRELLQAGRDFQVGDYDVAKGLEKHLSQIAAGTPAPEWAQSLQTAQGAGPGAAAAAAMGASGSLVPWVVLPIATAAVIAAVMLATSSEPPSPRATVVAPPSAATAAPHAAPSRAVQPVVPQLDAVNAQRTPEEARPAPQASSERAEPATPRANRSGARAAKRAGESVAKAAAVPGHAGDATGLPSKATPASTPLTGRASAPSAQPAAVEQPATTIALEEPQAQPEPTAAAERTTPEPQPAPQDDARLEREMAMLAMSQRVLHADPARALKLSRQGEAEFEGSMFTQERQQLLLLALVKLGQLDEAKRLAKPYLARYPKGPFSDRVRRALATGKVEQ